MRRLSNNEIEFLCDMYQRIADQRRIDWVNARDDRENFRLIAFAVLTLTLFLAGWVL